MKNHGCEFRIPYQHDGAERWYYPDFVAHIDDGAGPEDLLSLVLEVSGRDLPEKKAKVETAGDLLGTRREQPGELGPLGVLRGPRPVEPTD